MGQPAELDALLDTLGALLREFGKHAFDIEGLEGRATALRFERWAQHALTGAAPPGDDGTPVRGLGARQWPQIRRSFSEHRLKEAQHVQRTLDSFRQVLFAFLGGLNRLVAEDTESDGRLRQQAAKLEAAVKANATAEIRQLAMATLDSLEQSLDQRQRTHQEQMTSLGSRLVQLGEQLETVRRESTLDPLTDVFNRRAFDEYLHETVELSRVLREPCCLTLIDVDAFKSINDRFGHPVGDRVLHQLSAAITRTFRRKRDFVARYGGDEFVVLSRDLSSADAKGLGVRLLELVRGLKVEHEGQAIAATASVGFASLSPADDAASWLKRADQALYRAKHEGRDQVQGE